jgi:hypothetical protein
MAETVLDALIKARTLIADIKNWTQRQGARAINGRPVPITSDLACRWCAEGALLKVTGSNW